MIPKPSNYMKCSAIPAILLLLVLNFFALPLFGAETDLKDDLAKLQGKWKATVTTEQGTSIWKIETKGNKSTLVIESKDGDEIFKAEFDFKLEQHGSFKAYTYSNMKNLTGGRERAAILTDGKTKSSIYKIESDTFTTVSGFRTDDSEEKPLLIRWEKVPDEKK